MFFIGIAAVRDLFAKGTGLFAKLRHLFAEATGLFAKVGHLFAKRHSSYKRNLVRLVIRSTNRANDKPPNHNSMLLWY
ncbi:hypothetical protein [Neobacillus drentensis]|uniref:hypothetical protein n=1 Tax=Neobacillus drentensis TaxID=220684 RepID=UPI00300001F4